MLGITNSFLGRTYHFKDLFIADYYMSCLCEKEAMMLSAMLSIALLNDWHITFLLKIYIYLFGCTRSYLQHVESLVVACGIYLPSQGLNPVLLHWEQGVSATGPSGKPQHIIFLLNSLVEVCLSTLKHWLYQSSNFCLFS